MSDDEKDMVSCKFCPKTFANEKAFHNHARSEHLDEYLLQNNSLMHNIKTEKFPRLKPRKLTEKEEEDAKIRTEEMLQSMEPVDITSLASNDVDYVIMKAEDEPQVKKPKREKKKTIKMTSVRKEREIKPITGPFECMQPSTHSAQGLCHQIFASCCDYSAHYREEHTRRKIGPRCQICEKPLPGVDLNALYPCQVCGAGFQTRKKLTEHSQVAHAQLKPFQCSVCLKRFSQQGGLQQHMRMHTGERPYACTYCPKTFTQKSGCEQHLRIHTKEKPYKCVLCSKAFCQSIHLQQHMRTHTNVAPFECMICCKRFKQSSHLNCHIKNHNPATMTEDQKAKYEEFLSSIAKPEVVEVQINEDVVVEGMESQEVYII